MVGDGGNRDYDRPTPPPGQALRGPRHDVAPAVQVALVFFGYYALTSLALPALSALVPTPSRALEIIVLLTASAVGTVGRFLLLRGWVFAIRPHRTAGWYREDTR